MCGNGLRRICWDGPATGGPRQTIIVCFWKPFSGVVRTGAPWHDLAPAFGNWNSRFWRFRRWAKGGVFDGLFNAMNGDPELGTGNNRFIQGFLIACLVLAHGFLYHLIRLESDLRISPVFRRAYPMVRRFSQKIRRSKL